MAPSRKRLLNGDFKGKPLEAKLPAKGSKESREQFLKDVVELGGDEQDLELVEDADSDSEVEGSPEQPDKSLGMEVRNLAKELGIAGLSLKQKTARATEKGEREHRKADIFKADEDEEYSGDNVEESMPQKTHVKAKGGMSNLLLDPVAEWHSVHLSNLSEFHDEVSLPGHVVEALHQRGKDLLQKENEAFDSRHRSSKSSHQFYSTVIKSGTLTDKVSALTLLVQESPLHNTRALESLLGLAKKRSRAQAIEVLTALKDLFGLGFLLPSSRHLRVFASQPDLCSLSPENVKSYNASKLPPKPLTDSHLVLWAYEDWLKAKYFEVLQILETWSNDEITYSRGKAVDMLFELLREKPEQETNLLRLLVNKLGDSEKKVASRASYNLLQLQNPHPMMKVNILSAIESDILFRNGQSLHAKYYAITTLNQTVLSSSEDGVVRKLLDIYFALFLGLLAEQNKKPADEASQTNSKGEMQGGGARPGKMAKKKKPIAAQKGASVEEAMREKITSAILTGINRAVPYTNTNDEFFENHMDTLFKITHSSNFNTSIQAMMLIQQLCGSHPSAFDRFYRTLYESLLDPRLLDTSKKILYLNLLYRALKSDLNVKRVQAFAKRLLQVVAMHQPAFVCAVIYLLRELESVFPSLSTFIDQPEENLDEESRALDMANDDPSSTPKFTKFSGYDGKKRAPEFSNADQSCLWELEPFLTHYHPSVTLFASRLLCHEGMPSKPTLDQHTLIQFLDRFVYRNPKKHPNKWHGASIMQPRAAGDSRGQLLAPPQAGPAGKQPVNSTAFASLGAHDVSADEVFFHNYFRKMGPSKAKKKDKKKLDTEDSDEEVTGEDAVWQALVDSRPDIEGSESDDVGLDAGDFSDDSALDLAMNDLSSGSDMESDEGEMLEAGELDEPTDTATEEEEKLLEERTRKTSRNEESKRRKKQLRELPTFASADDYAAMVENVEGEIEAP